LEKAAPVQESCCRRSATNKPSSCKTAGKTLGLHRCGASSATFLPRTQVSRYRWHQLGTSRAALDSRPTPPTRGLSTRCGLTSRSSGAPTACRTGHQALGLRPILRLLSSAPCRRRPLSSNVRPQSSTMQVSRAQNKHTLYASCVSVAASEWNATSRNTSGRQPFQIAGRVGCISSVEPAGAWRPVNQRSPPRCRYYSSRKQSHSPRASPAGSHARAVATGNRERLVWVPLHP